MNLSAPSGGSVSGGSVNDGVDKESVRFSYTSVDAIADRVGFGLRSAPLIFTTVADTLQWMMQLDGAML